MTQQAALRTVNRDQEVQGWYSLANHAFHSNLIALVFCVLKKGMR